MLHLFNTAVNPRTPLAQALQNWSDVARRLSEPPRRRQYQLERLGVSLPLS
jgi:hypothetical protein